MLTPDEQAQLDALTAKASEPEHDPAGDAVVDAAVDLAEAAADMAEAAAEVVEDDEPEPEPVVVVDPAEVAAAVGDAALDGAVAQAVVIEAEAAADVARIEAQGAATVAVIEAERDAEPEPAVVVEDIGPDDDAPRSGNWLTRAWFGQ